MGLWSLQARGGPSSCRPIHPYNPRKPPAYPEVLHAVHILTVDLQEPVTILQALALGWPPRLQLADDVPGVPQLRAQVEAKDFTGAAAQQVEAGLSLAVPVCRGAEPESPQP